MPCRTNCFILQLDEKDREHVALKAHCHNLEIRLKDLEHLKVCVTCFQFSSFIITHCKFLERKENKNFLG